MKIYENAKELIRRGFDEREKELAAVKEIIADVRARGDKAVFEYESQFDGAVLTKRSFRVSPDEILRAYNEVSPDLLESLRLAIGNIYTYHMRRGCKDDVREENGRTTGFVVRPVKSAGIYVPGGTAPLASSVLMGVLPAKAAGVERIVVATPAKNGKIHPLILVAANECGANEIYKVGGAQAIAALAYGTESLKKVNVIAGPGNIYVTLAKKEVYGQVGIDMLAGPSEILIIADKTADPDFIAADILSQAEHDVLSRAVVLTDDAELARKISLGTEERLRDLPRSEIAREALKRSGGIVLVKNMAQACLIADDFAPEHLELFTKHPEDLLPHIHNAGAVFLGGYTPEPVGDYFAGPDHILPTGGSAAFFQALNEDTFTRRMSIISYTQEALAEDAEHIIELAESEGLYGHAAAVRARIGKITEEL